MYIDSRCDTVLSIRLHSDHKMADFGIFYGQLFSEGFFVADETRPYFQEMLLQVIWNEQWLKQPLRTASGDEVMVLHPGVWNLEGGPDFRDAALVIGGQPRRGPVEIHFSPANWNQHGHQHDRAYDDVILHVVWQNPGGTPQSPPGIPVLEIEPQLSRPMHEIVDAIDLHGYPYARKVAPDELAAYFSNLTDDHLQDLFSASGIARILRKARDISMSIEKVGLDETAYRMLCDGLGYKANREPFRQLAEKLLLSTLAEQPTLVSQALLFGTAGLLPDPSQHPVPDPLRAWTSQLWSAWWRRQTPPEELAWKRAGLRPSNTPERRMLALVHLLERAQWRPGSHLLDAILSADSSAQAVRNLREFFNCIAEPPFDRFHHFGGMLDKPTALIGASRANDLIVNLAIPLYFACCFFRNRALDCAKGKQALLRMPKLQSNRALEEAVHRFFIPPSRSRDVIANACAQQGLLGLYREHYG